jgi:DNA-binding PucR family transcriptional regulator
MEISSTRDNILFYDDFALYLVIDMATEQFKQTLGSNDIILLCAPAVITLTRYDKKHHTNLRDVLFHYLHNGRSISKTAEVLYMHRNTVLNKLKKIQELCPLDLEDGISTEILMFSCQLTKYYEEYMNLELRL